MTQEATTKSPAENAAPPNAEQAPAPTETPAEATADTGESDESSDAFYDALLGAAEDVTGVDLGDQPAEETTPAEEAPAAETEAKPAEAEASAEASADDKPADGDETAEGEPGEGKPRRKEVEVPNWRKRMFERKAKQAATKEAEAKQQEAKLAEIATAALEPHLTKQQEVIEQLRAQLTEKKSPAPKPEAMSLADADPFELMQRLANERGITPDQAFQYISAKVLGQEAPPLPPPRPKVAESPEVVALRKQVEALQAEQKKLAESALTPERLYQQQAQAQIQADIGRIVSVQSNAKLAEAYPHLAALPPDRLAIEARDAMNTAIANERWDLIGEGVGEMMRLLDKGVAEEYAFIQSRIKAQQGAPNTPADSSQAQGKPPQGKPGKPKATSNKAAAAVSGQSSTATEDAAYDALSAML